MEAYTFHDGSLPNGVTLDYEPAIFNLPAFVAMQDPLPARSFYLVDRGKAVAGVHFHLSGNTARSPFKAPFGSLECSDLINPARLYRFVEFVETRLKESGIEEIYIKDPPRAYAPRNLSLLEVFFINRGYAIVEAETGAAIPVKDTLFRQVIRHSEKLRLRQGENAGLNFKELSPDRLEEVYDFIAGCHHKKGYGLSITASHLMATARLFPGRYHAFAVLRDETIVAASVAIRVKEKILYNFLMNHEKDFNPLSPTVRLMEGMYAFCQANNISLFDLGTSALHGAPNFTLLDFKMHTGGEATSKFTFHKKIN